MGVRFTDPEIDVENPFQNDKVERRQCAEVLTQFFNNFNSPFVLCLNSARGNGKTTFIKMFRQHLINQGFPSIYFNASEADYQDSPLIAIIGEIHSGIEELKRYGFEIERAKKLYKKIKKNGKDIIKKAIPFTIKTAFNKPLDIEKGMDDAYAEFTSGVLEEQIKNYSASKNHVIEFKKHLNEFVEQLQSKDKEQTGIVKPLIFFIDELDCCRPDYAVQVLDRIRRLFDVKGVITVIVADMDQLGYSVKTVFGQNIKERGFLRKFIDLEYNLPADNNISELYCNYLSNETPVAEIMRKNKDADILIDELKYSSILMALTFSMSLRDLNMLFNILYPVFLSYDKLKTETVALSVILVSLKMRHTGLYNKAVNKERSVIYFINELNKIKKDAKVISDYDEFFIERRFSSLYLKPVSSSEYQHQLHNLSLGTGSELAEIYKIIKERNRSGDNEFFTDNLLRKIKLLDSLKFAGKNQ